MEELLPLGNIIFINHKFIYLNMTSTILDNLFSAFLSLGCLSKLTSFQTSIFQAKSMKLNNIGAEQQIEPSIRF